MNILEKIQQQMKETRILHDAIRDITANTEFVISFLDHFNPMQVIVFKSGDFDYSVMCLINKDGLAPMDDQSPTQDLIDTLAYVNKEVSKL